MTETHADRISRKCREFAEQHRRENNAARRLAASNINLPIPEIDEFRQTQLIEAGCGDILEEFGSVGPDEGYVTLDASMFHIFWNMTH